MDEFDFNYELRTAAKAAREVAFFVRASERDIVGLDELNALGRDALSLWRNAASSAARVVQRHLDQTDH